MSTAQTLITITLGVASILGLGFGLIRHLVKFYLSELRPDNNGGHNLRGRVERIENQVDRIYEILLEERLSR